MLPFLDTRPLPPSSCTPPARSFHASLYSHLTNIKGSTCPDYLSITSNTLTVSTDTLTNSPSYFDQRLFTKSKLSTPILTLNLHNERSRRNKTHSHGIRNGASSPDSGAVDSRFSQEQRRVSEAIPRYRR